MDDPRTLKRTPLHELHRRAGARMVPFAGWEMPIQYAGVVEEHLAVRNRAGLFDVSHMGQVELRGPGAEAALQRLTCNDVSSLRPGMAHYSALLDEAGGILDDVIVYRRTPDDILVVVNAANAAADAAWLEERATGQVEVHDRSDELALLALQGPEAAAILEASGEPLPADLTSFRCADRVVAGVECMVGRTGYTGEDGFELMLPAGDAPRLWTALLEVGAARGIMPVGLGARDTLRLEAGLLLHGTDMTRADTPLQAGLGFIVKLDAGDFLGRDVLVRQREQGLDRRLAGIEMIDRGIARGGHPVWGGEERLGEVTSGSYAPFLRKNIARAWLPARCAPGDEVEVEIRERRLQARVVKTPFYRRVRR